MLVLVRIRSRFYLVPSNTGPIVGTEFAPHFSEQMIPRGGWESLCETIRYIVVSTDMCGRNNLGCHTPSTMVIGNQRTLLIQRRLYICCIFIDTFVVRIHVSWLTLRHGNTKTSQFKSQFKVQVLNRLSADFQGIKLS